MFSFLEWVQSLYMLKIEITPIAVFSCMAMMLLVFGMSKDIQLLVLIFLFTHMMEHIVSGLCVLKEGKTG